MNTKTKPFIYYLLMTLLTGVATCLFIADIFIYKTANAFDYVAAPIVTGAYIINHYNLLQSIEP